MHVNQRVISTERYAKCIEVSRRVRWDIDRDVIRGREFDFSRKFLPDGISRLGALDFLDADDKRLLSQIQGRAPLAGTRPSAMWNRAEQLGQSTIIGHLGAQWTWVRPLGPSALTAMRLSGQKTSLSQNGLT